MYDSLTRISGIEAVNQYLSGYPLTPGPDGLSVIFDEEATPGAEVMIPDRLREWLIGLRLLRNIPLSYLVPDAALLPPESIRFFHVDPTWVDRVIDGVFSAANTGTVDFVFSYRMLQATRWDLDFELTEMAKAKVDATTWDGAADTMTGMLIRSELVRRWPDMVIRAYDTTTPPAPADPHDPPEPTIALLRAEPISKDIYIALFAGQPKMVHVREPNVGTRYGVESTLPSGGPPYKVDARPENGETPEAGPDLNIIFRPPGDPQHLRILDLKALAESSAQPGNLGTNSPRQVALNLEQFSYVQEFKNTVQEPVGSIKPDTIPNNEMTFRRGRGRMTLDKLIARKADLDALGS